MLACVNDARYRASAPFTKDQAYWLKHCVAWPELVMLTNRPALVLHHRLRQTIYFSYIFLAAHSSACYWHGHSLSVSFKRPRNG